MWKGELKGTSPQREHTHVEDEEAHGLATAEGHARALTEAQAMSGSPTIIQGTRNIIEHAIAQYLRGLLLEGQGGRAVGTSDYLLLAKGSYEAGESATKAHARLQPEPLIGWQSCARAVCMPRV